MAVLEGKATPAQHDAVIANAAMALYAANQKEGLTPAVEKATESLDSGKAFRTFRKLIDSQN
jgi:anthranilate phosphoribosyltransferase